MSAKSCISDQGEDQEQDTQSYEQWQKDNKKGEQSRNTEVIGADLFS